jgi:hypothetical protein
VRKSHVKWKSVTTRSTAASSSLILQQFHLHRTTVPCVIGSPRCSARCCIRRDLKGATKVLRGQDRTTSGSAASPLSRAPRAVKCNSTRGGYHPIRRARTSRFPQIPLLGFDIVREVSTSKLFVLEANAIGYVGNFDARIKTSYDFSAEAQFDGLRKAAYILAEKTQQSAD